MSEHADALEKVLSTDEENWSLDPWAELFYYDRPEKYEFKINRAAIMLSRVDRFQSQVRISVARHSINVSKLMYYRAEVGIKCHFGMAGLLHDIEEAWVGDMPTPLKRLCPDFCRISDGIKRQAIDAFWPKQAAGPYADFAGDYMKEIDMEVCQLERNLHMPDSQWWPRTEYGIPNPLKLSDVYFDFPHAADVGAFMTEYNRLARGMATEHELMVYYD